RAGVAARTTAGGHQHDRALRLPGGEHAGELEQAGRARELGARAPRCGVAVREDHDRGSAAHSRALRDHARERAFAVDRLRPEAAHVHAEATAGRAPQTFDRVTDLLRQASVLAAAPAALWELHGEGV